MVESVRTTEFSLSDPVGQEDKLLVFAEGDLAAAFCGLLGVEAVVVARVVGRQEGSEGEVGEVLRSQGVTLVVVRNPPGQSDALGLAR